MKNITISILDRNEKDTIPTEIKLMAYREIERLLREQYSDTTEIEVSPLRGTKVLWVNALPANDMRLIEKVSRKYPNYLFIVDFEEVDMAKRIYVSNGGSHEVNATTTYPKFDPTKLKTDPEHTERDIKRIFVSLLKVYGIELDNIKSVTTSSDNSIEIHLYDAPTKLFIITIKEHDNGQS